MRKHPLIALIAFAFLAISIFVGAAGAGGINSIPVRATTHLAVGSGPRADDLRAGVALARERESAARSAMLVLKAQAPYWQGRSADSVALHNESRLPGGMLPSQWRAHRIAAVHSALARAAAANALAVEEEAAAKAQAEQQAQQAQQAEAEQQAQLEQSAQVAQVSHASHTSHKSHVAHTSHTTAAPRAPARPRSSGGGNIDGVWLQLRLCESGNNYAEDTGNGYYGAYQFALSTWLNLGYSGLPSDASPAVQDQAAQKLQALAGWGQWPACSAELGL